MDNHTKIATHFMFLCNMFYAKTKNPEIETIISGLRLCIMNGNCEVAIQPAISEIITFANKQKDLLVARDIKAFDAPTPTVVKDKKIFEQVVEQSKKTFEQLDSTEKNKFWIKVNNIIACAIKCAI